MNKEQQQIIDEAYENYGKRMTDIFNVLIPAEFMDKGWVKLNNQGKYDVLSKEEFINKCKIDNEFSEKWGLKIDERELSEGERGLLLQPLGLDPLTKEGRDRLWKENNLPTKLITITRELSHEERINLCLQSRPGSKFAAHYETNETLMNDWNIPTNTTIESYG